MNEDLAIGPETPAGTDARSRGPQSGSVDLSMKEWAFIVTVLNKSPISDQQFTLANEIMKKIYKQLKQHQPDPGSPGDL
jgi:hypothetical protein